MVTNTYYTTQLYPLQDKALKAISACKTSFYLTGGTALSRAYYNHRYSDDLDFFVNQDSTYTDQVEIILTALIKQFTIKITHRSESFLALTLQDKLKLDFVNDISFHSGKILKKILYPQVDNVTNILSNKLSALISRDEAKDVVDIITIAANEKVNWPQIFTDVNSKAVGIFPPDIVKRLNEFPLELIDQIKWVNTIPAKSDFAKQVKEISKDILTG